MALATTDIVFVLSGGSLNTDPDASLGGEPSAQPISAKRLFDDLSEEETAQGHTDFRCFYIANDNGDDTLYDVRIFIKTQVDAGAVAEIGFNFQDDRQEINVTNATSLTGGNFTVVYDETDAIVVQYNSDISVWTANFQNAIRAVSGLEDVTVAGNIVSGKAIFEVNFPDSAGKRWHPLLEVTSNNLEPVATASVSSAKLVDGGPINSIADEIDVDTTTPNNIVFFQPTEAEPLSIGDLRPFDSFPVWIRRTVEAGAAAVENDGFTVQITGSPIA